MLCIVLDMFIEEKREWNLDKVDFNSIVYSFLLIWIVLELLDPLDSSILLF
jgi:hypothetical protein